MKLEELQRRGAEIEATVNSAEDAYTCMSITIAIVIVVLISYEGWWIRGIVAGTSFLAFTKCIKEISEVWADEALEALKKNSERY